MGRRRGSMMSEEFKMELAKELGFYDKVKAEGWGAITTRDAGNMVKRAVQMAQEALAAKKL
ncbi:protein SspF [Brevibacillus reuszeri]|uniref:small, acid-soluble spore protein, alpha/beta type n=1 Tax=Brevibacillus reuszeri TaxID=54915 RepID=UPI000CCC580C|nr:small, acid-soluble spore protein, alpha/beta type [Brevibacillus reuszeri]GIO09817.1 protein SspF [Brevibacillus reuszeri]